MLTNKQRSYLSGLASKEHETVYIGKAGITDEVIIQISNDLKAHEFVKCKVQNNAPISAEQAAEEAALRTDAEVVRTIGSKFILYKKNPKAKHPLLKNVK